MNRKVLYDLKPDSYIHPMERKVRIESGSLLANGLDFAGNLNLEFIKRITLGCNLEATRQTCPRIIRILEDVCRILDCRNIPRVYISHAASQTFYIAGGKKTQIVMSDYILDQFTEGMLYHAFGNLISMLKAGHIRLATICSMMVAFPHSEVLMLPVQALMRAADLTSDRGGLLACQDFGASAMCMLWEAGIPISDMEEKSTSEMISLAEQYIHASEWMSETWLTGVAQAWNKLNMQTMPPAYRLKELLDWYRNGSYREILANA